MNYQKINKIISYSDYPQTQKFECLNYDQYIFIREKLGNNYITSDGTKFGNYLYRNITNGVLIASYEKPTNKKYYTGYDIGTNTDALIYYKNE